MLIDTQPVSSWFVLHQGFKVYAQCPSCKSSSILYFKARMTGYKGFAAQCEGCDKHLPVRMKAVQIGQNRRRAVS